MMVLCEVLKYVCVCVCMCLCDGHSLSFQILGNKLFTGSADSMIRCWQCSSQECLQVYRGHKNTINDLTLCGELCKQCCVLS